MSIKPVVERFFTSYLPATCGFSVNESQVALAHDVCDMLEGTIEPLMLAEAETGTGKSLAYLVPCMIYLANHSGKRIGISSHSRTLQLQLNSELERVKGYMTEIGLNLPKTALYLGQRAFLDQDSAEQELSILLDSGALNTLSHQRALATLQEVMAQSGVIDDFLYRLELDGIQLEVDKRALSGKTDGQYSLNQSEVDAAQLVIYTHVALLSAAQYKRKLNLDFIIADEADTMPQTCQLLSRSSISHTNLIKTVDAMSLIPAGDKKVTQSRNAAVSSLLSLSALVEEFDMNHSEYKILKAEESESFQDSVKQVNKSLLKLNKAIETSSLCIGAAPLNPVADLLESVSHMTRFSGFMSLGISSTKTGKRTLSFQMPSSSWIIKALVEEVDAAAFLSATLRDVVSEQGFGEFQRFLDASESECATRVYAPTDFGRLTFEFYGSSMPAPFARNKAAAHNPDWIDSVVNTINGKAKEGKGVLVLTPSYQECATLLKHPNASEWLSNIHGQSLKSVVDRFAKTGGVLISPSVWSGFSARKPGGGQLFDTLIITRLPIPPQDPKEIAHLNEWASISGKSLNASAIHFGKNRVEALKKCRQGFGRPIRHPDDRAHIVVCDSRASSLGTYSSSLLKLIPKRFTEQYLNHQWIHPNVANQDEEGMPWDLL